MVKKLNSLLLVTLPVLKLFPNTEANFDYTSPVQEKT